MSFDVLNRFDRIVAILIQLQSSRVVKAQDLADRFQVSLRTVYRDIRSLEASGVPIISEAGVGYSIMDGYRLPPVMFTREEAGSFVAAEKLMQKFTDKSLGAHYESAMYKLKSVLRGREKDWIETLESQVSIQPMRRTFNENIPNALEIFFESIAEKNQVLLQYQAFKADTISERKIEPIGLFHENNYWYIMAYCHLRKDYRQFRADRITAIKRTEIPFHREHPPMETQRIQQRPQKSGKIKVRILTDQKVLKYIQESRAYYGYISEEKKGDKVEMTFVVNEIDEGFPRWYLMFGDCAQIIEPPELKDRVKEIMNKTLEGL